MPKFRIGRTVSKFVSENSKNCRIFWNDRLNLKIKTTMLTKAKLLAEIKTFPEEFSIDQLVERLILIEKVEIGRKQSEAEDIVSEEEMEYEVKKWFK